MNPLVKQSIYNFPSQSEILAFLATRISTTDTRIQKAVAEHFKNSSYSSLKLEGEVLIVLEPFSKESHWSEDKIQTIKTILCTALITLATPPKDSCCVIL